MKPAVAVVALTSAFEREWAALVTHDSAQVIVVSAVDEVPAGAELCAIVVAAGGEEGRLGPEVARARSRRLADIAAVGASADHRLAVGLLQQGAGDYFALPEDYDALRDWISTRIAAERSSPTEATLRRYDFSGVVGRSPKLLAALDRAAKVIPRDATTVLITGETGTGKELLARAIHDNGPRRAQQFIDINCAAIPATLLEAELFGYEKGAFTDAKQAKPGLIEGAHQGTLFLDEIGDMSLELQAKLLKVLESRRVRRLGALREREVDARIIAATNSDLRPAVREGRFRADLYYRLAVVPIHLPPLRERGEDILILAQHFLAHFAGLYAIRRPLLSVSARRALLAHHWPGNVRELRNVVERAVVLGDGLLEPGLLSGDVRELATSQPLSLPFPAPLDAIDRAAARATVERLSGNKTAAAAALGVSRKHLYTLLATDPGGPGRHEDTSGDTAIRIVR